MLLNYLIFSLIIFICYFSRTSGRQIRMGRLCFVTRHERKHEIWRTKCQRVFAKYSRCLPTRPSRNGKTFLDSVSESQTHQFYNKFNKFQEPKIKAMKGKRSGQANLNGLTDQDKMHMMKYLQLKYTILFLQQNKFIGKYCFYGMTWKNKKKISLIFKLFLRVLVLTCWGWFWKARIWITCW